MSSPYVVDSSPRWASAPGDTISKLLRAQGMTPEDLADALQISDPEVRKLIRGELEITETVARGLSVTLGSTAEFWSARENQYRESVLWLEVDDLVQRSPVHDLIGRGWMPEATAWRDQAQALLDYYDVGSADEWTQKWEARLSSAHFRSSPSFESDDLAIAAWLRQVDVQAERANLATWSPSSLRSAISKLRTISRIGNPERSIPLAAELLAGAGVALVVLPATTGNRLSGAAFETESGARVIGLTGRHRSDDHLWFTMFHEIGHLLLHGADGEFLNILDVEDSDESDVELQANTFARETLLPNGVDELRDLRANGPRTREVLAFANAEGVAPGVVVGRLHHDGVLEHNRLRGLIRQYKWDGTTLKI